MVTTTQAGDSEGHAQAINAYSFFSGQNIVDMSGGLLAVIHVQFAIGMALKMKMTTMHNQTLQELHTCTYILMPLHRVVCIYIQS